MSDETIQTIYFAHNSFLPRNRVRISDTTIRRTRAVRLYVGCPDLVRSSGVGSLASEKNPAIGERLETVFDLFPGTQWCSTSTQIQHSRIFTSQPLSLKRDRGIWKFACRCLSYTHVSPPHCPPEHRVPVVPYPERTIG